MKKRAFTLAELLVTSGIIVIITTLMISVLYNRAPNREQIMIKKVYTQVGNIVANMVNSEEWYGKNSDGTDSLANTGVVTYKGYTFGDDNPENNAAKNKFCNVFKTYLNIAKTNAECGTALTFTNNQKSDGNFVTTDGIIWIIPQVASTGFPVTISVDVTNNSSGDSNCSARGNVENCTKGPDRFDIIVNSDGTLDVPPNDFVLRYYLNHTEFNKSFKTLKPDIVKYSNQNTTN